MGGAVLRRPSPLARAGSRRGDRSFRERRPHGRLRPVRDLRRHGALRDENHRCPLPLAVRGAGDRLPRGARRSRRRKPRVVRNSREVGASPTARSLFLEDAAVAASVRPRGQLSHDQCFRLNHMDSQKADAAVDRLPCVIGTRLRTDSRSGASAYRRRESRFRVVENLDRSPLRLILRGRKRQPLGYASGARLFTICPIRLALSSGDCQCCVP